MRVLLLGCGLQGRAALDDLVRSRAVERIVCADADAGQIERATAASHTDKIVAIALDASERSALVRAMQDIDVVIDLLPRRFVRVVAEAAIAARVHLVNTYYDTQLADLDAAARAAGIAILPEMGLDPGIDLVMAAEAVRRFDKITRLASYGGGLPEPGADDNPLRYRISWTFDGVLDSYARPSRLIDDGRIVDVPATDIFAQQHIHTLDIDPFGALQAYPNGDAIRYARRLGIADSVTATGRYALRWPGHCEFWRVMSGLGFLSADAEPALGGIAPREFLRRHLEPRLQYGPRQRDLVILRVEAHGTGAAARALTLQLTDYRDLDTGLMAMNRTVGFPASIAAQMIATGTIRRRGLLSPIVDVPWAPFVSELAARDIIIVETAT